MSLRRRGHLLFATTLSEVLYLGLARAASIPPASTWGASWLTPVRFEQTAPFLALWIGLCLGYGLGVRAARESRGAFTTLFVLATSALFRVTLLTGTGFDGSPTAPSPGLETAPPDFLTAFSQQRLAMVASILGIDAGLLERALIIVLDLGALVLLSGLLKANTLPAGLALVYGWCPLAVKESAADGRWMFLGIALLALALSRAVKRILTIAAGAYGAAVVVLPSLFAAAPLWMRGLRWSSVVAIALVSISSMSGLGALEAFLGTAVPSSTWGGSLYPIVETLLRIFVTREPGYPIVLCYGGWLAFVVYRTIRFPGDPRGLARESLVAVGSFLLVSPRVLPWSFVPVAYLAAFSPNRGWLLFPLTAALAYLSVDGEWSFWLGFAQYALPYFMLIFDALGRPPEPLR